MTSQPLRLHAATHLPQGQDPLPGVSQMPWILLQGISLNGTVVPSGSDYYPQLTNLLVSPLNGGGTIDSTVFGGIDPGGSQIPVMTGGSSNEPFKAIQVLQPGFYYLQVGIGWYLNWGTVRVNYDVSHSDGFTSVVSSNIFIHGAANSYFGEGSDGTAPQVVMYATTFVSVDSRATDVQVRGFVHNSSGVSRTYGTNPSTNVGELFRV